MTEERANGVWTETHCDHCGARGLVVFVRDDVKVSFAPALCPDVCAKLPENRARLERAPKK